MNKNNIISSWECECLSQNPIRARRCKACGRSIPNQVLSQIYYEELKQQKALVIIEDLELSEERCLKIGNILEKRKRTIVPAMIALVIILNAGRYCLSIGNTNAYVHDGIERRQERFWNETNNVQEAMDGLKSTPLVVAASYNAIVTKVMEVTEGIYNNHEMSEKHVDYGKIEHARRKIEGVIEYVTSTVE